MWLPAVPGGLIFLWHMTPDSGWAHVLDYRDAPAGVSIAFPRALSHLSQAHNLLSLSLVSLSGVGYGVESQYGYATNKDIVRHGHCSTLDL